MPRIEAKTNYIFERVRDPSLFIKNGMRQRVKGHRLVGKPSTFKTVHSGGHLITIGRLKSTGKTAAQRILHPIREAGYAGGPHKFRCKNGLCRRLR